MDRVDVAIVGGGAAGIAAARELSARKLSVLLIEALPQLGGRARTLMSQGMPLDLGCGWLHSADRNPLTALAEASGQTVDNRESAWRHQLGDIAFPAQDQRDAWRAFRLFGDRLRSTPPPSDRAGDAVARDDRWRPFIDGMSSFINGVELDELSAADYIAYDSAATDANWRLPDGYGAFIAGLGAGLPVALETKVSAISQQKDVVLETSRGTIHARAAIVTVSSTILAEGGIRFTPSPDDHLHAASCLPLGLADKVFLSIASPEAVPAESHLLGRADRAETGSYYLRPFGRPIVECFLGGSWARALERAGKEAAASFAIEELGRLLGAGFARGLTPIAVTSWGQEATIGGSYSHALPGHADARLLLASPVSERLIFAGEACSREDFSTAHGAWQSGLAAADRLERFLSARGG